MIDATLVDLSRLQFALTAMYHFLFVPLTLGLACILAIMESVYVLTGLRIYKEMTQFWGKLFGINFAMGVATGITMEFQFGTNWAYYSHYVGDIFGVPLAVEGLMAFFLESTFVGLFFFGWDRLSRAQHLMVTWLLAIGSSLSALLILIANAWMQYPVGAEFNYVSMRMELTDLWAVLFNPVAQVKFVHTVAAGYVTGAIFVLAVSSYYLLRQRHIDFARRSFAVAAGFGLAAVLSVIVLGDASGYEVGAVQKVKLAAIESEWETQTPPASFTLFGIPNEDEQRTDYAIRIPYAMGLLATHTVDMPVLGLNALIEENAGRIRQGIRAVALLKELKTHPTEKTEKAFDAVKQDLGYGLLLKRYVNDPNEATEADIQMAARHSIPKVAPLFWSFRIMVGLGFWMLFLIACAFYFNLKSRLRQNTWLLRGLLYSLPAPWIAIMCGWIVAEYGRQPWAIAEILPTFLSVSSVSVGQVWTSLGALIVLYSGLLVVELYLMIKYVRQGPMHV